MVLISRFFSILLRPVLFLWWVLTTAFERPTHRCELDLLAESYTLDYRFPHHTYTSEYIRIMATLTRSFHRTFSRAKIVPRQPPSLVSTLSPTSPLHKLFGGLEYPLIEAPTKAGPAWTATQLRRKSYDDLHKLWYVCLLRKTQQETIKEEMIRVNLYKAQESWKDDQTTAKVF